MSYLDTLNPAQRQAVEHIEGPALIIAGPGSGKTRVLTYRIAHLIDKGVDPFNILALTFTNKASAEMRHRIEGIVGTEARNLYMGTFHSVFARLLRFDAKLLGYPSNFTIYDTQDSKNMIKRIVSEQKLNEKLYKPNIVLNRISSAKNSLISPKEYQEDPELMGEDAASGRKHLGKLYEIYAQRCFQAGAMDFDDLLYQTFQLITKFPKILYKYQHKFKFILIDEFQDTNHVQYAIVRKIADVFQNICVVGDDAQSIYAFRGATIQNILNFERDFPDLKVYKLEQNYRSTQNIVSAANGIIGNNRNQLKKTIWTENDEGQKIKVLKAASDNEEGRAIAQDIFEIKMREHLRNNDFAILYRTNAQSRAFEEALRRINIAYTIYGGLSFYQRKEIKDLLAYLKVTVNPQDEESMLRIINYPTRGIGKTTIERLTVSASNAGVPLWTMMENIHQSGLSGRAATNISGFVTMIKSFQTMLEEKNAFDLASHIARSTGILKELYNDKSVEGVSRYENLQELLNGIKEFTEDDTVTDENELNQDRSLGSYLQNITLLTNDDSKDENDDTVKLMTVHSAKGLEFKVVYVVGLEENLFPSNMSLYDRDDLEEERRLFYVAVTRAMQHLTLSYATSRYRFGDLQFYEPSRFLAELPQEILSIHGELKKPRSSSNTLDSLSRKLDRIDRQRSSGGNEVQENFVPDDASELQPGMDVEHQRFGRGKVVSFKKLAGNQIAVIEFDGAGQKQIMLKFAKLKILKGKKVD